VPGAIASLLLAARKGDGRVYVRTGFKHDEARTLKTTLDELKTTLDKLKTRLPPVKLPRKSLVLSSPTLTAEIECRALTDDGELRRLHEDLRERQENTDIFAASH
jgi:bifunctional non-homologous end joining protein LigD